MDGSNIKADLFMHLFSYNIKIKTTIVKPNG